jgi:hypothetical protein
VILTRYVFPRVASAFVEFSTAAASAILCPVATTLPEPRTQRGAGGTPGGLGQFFIGLVMTVAGGYLTTRSR